MSRSERAENHVPRMPAWRRLLIGTAGFLLIAVMLLYAAGSGWVLRMASPWLSRAVSQAIEGHFEITGVEGNLWTGFSVEQVVVDIPQTGLAVDAAEARLDWQPWALLKGGLQINQASVERLDVMLPDMSASDTSQETEDGSGLVGLPLSVRLGELAFEEIQIFEPLRDRTFLYGLHAAGEVDDLHSGKLSFLLEPLDGSIDRLDAAFEFNGDRNYLTARVDGRLDHAGLVMALAGLPPEEAPDVILSLTGMGPMDDWQGDFVLDAANKARLAGEVGLGITPAGLDFAFDGKAVARRGIGPDIPSSLLGEVELGLTGALTEEGRRLRITRLALDKTNVAVGEATAEIDLDKLTGDISLRADLQPALSALADNVIGWEGLGIQAQVTGDLGLPTIRADLTGHSVTTPVSTAQGLSLIAELVPAGERMSLTADLASVGTEWREPTLASLLTDNIALSLDADTAADFSDLRVDNLEIPSLGIRAEGRVRTNAETGLSGENALIDIADISLFRPVTALDQAGRVRIGLSDWNWTAATGGAGDVTIEATDLATGFAELDHILGHNPAIAASIALSPDMDITAGLDDIRAQYLSGKANARLTDGFSQMSADLNLTVEPGAVPPDIDVALSEQARVAGDFNGPLARPGGEIRITAPGIQAGGETFDDIALTTTLGWLSDGVPKLGNEVSFGLRGRAFGAAADILLRPDRLDLPDLRLSAQGLDLCPDRLDLPDLRLSAQGLDLSGEMTLPEYRMPAVGNVSVSQADMGLLADWGVPGLQGNLAGELGVQSVDAAQTVTAEMTLSGFGQAGASGAGLLAVDTIDLKGAVSDVLAGPVMDLDVKARGLKAEKLAMDQVDASVGGPLSALEAEMSASGSYGPSLPLTLAGHLQASVADAITVNADQLDIAVGDQSIGLLQPLRFSRSSAGTVRLDGRLSAGKGRIETQLAFDPGKSIAARLMAQQVQIAGWAALFDVPAVQGLVSLEASLDERANQAPVAGLQVEVAELGLDDARDLPPLSLDMQGDLADNAVKASLSLKREGQAVANGRLSAPVNLSALSGELDVDEGAPLSGTASVDSEIEDFWPYVPLPDHVLSGRVNADVSVEGTMGNPAWDGRLSLKNGAYENLRFGTVLRDIRLNGAFNTDGLVIHDLSANDGGQGQLSGKADLDLAAPTGLSYNGSLSFSNVAVARLDELRAWTDLSLTIRGDGKEAFVESNATIRRGELDLAAALPASVPTLEVENLDRPGEDPEGEAAKEAAYPVNLDMTVEIPGRFFVRGKGVDSEWGGSLQITGQADDPKIVGKLEALRGQLDVVGKTFVVKDSTIVFTGAQPPDPLLNISGQYETDDLEVTATFGGPASDPALTLSSSPDMPQDEILSRVLFGRSQGNLSAVEAVQLANAAAELSGQGGGLDVVGTLRRFIGLDVLRVEGGDEGPSVKAGEYLTEGVYVGTKQGMTPGSTGVEVEVEITPLLKATSEATEADTKAGLQFKYDY